MGQTFQDVEFLCIDDGSTDGSAELLEQYARQDGRIHVLRQDNRGLSCARNVGMDAARGTYLCFLDSDDLLKPGALDRICEAMEAGQLDLLFFEFDLRREEGGWLIGDGTPGAWHRSHAHGGVTSGQALFVDFYLNGDYRCMVWGLCLRRSLAAERGLRFDEGIVHEDKIFTMRALFAARRAGHLYESLYIYRLRGGSVMGTPPTPLKLRSRIQTIEEMLALGQTPALLPAARTCLEGYARFLIQITANEFQKWLENQEKPQCSTRTQRGTNTTAEKPLHSVTQVRR